MSQSSTGEEAFGRIVRSEVSRVVRGSALQYLANAILLVVFGSVWLYLPSYSPPSLAVNVLSTYQWVVALYAIVVYWWTRSQQNNGLSIHFYLLGLMGLTSSGLFFAFGAVGFLRAGFYRRQFQQGQRPRCVRDGGSIAIFGDKSLVCTTCSRLMKIGYELPRRWNYMGVILLLAGIALYSLATISPTIAGAAYLPLNIPVLLLLDGIALLSPLYFQRMYLPGRVRLPPDTVEAQVNGKP